MKRFHLIVHGRVQGVGFRYFTQYEALKRQLTGWVRNNDDGTVELEVQGNEEAIQLFIDTIREGTLFAKVTDVSAQEIPIINNETQFRIMY
ncbi:acylphosphatase [Geobacillus sp. NFOSA3]|uniref:Acylphosphatase n=1 Tax=Parageobacillus galactosidasius TaxID=883812 RepID=A0A226QMQ0_9BACL|nr:MULTISPECIES: acylphosphatase [Parageobacillus]NNU93264.1 acylphosphatase [Geobacillus sp. NFOSA3]OQP02432.1 acylphosphatase [Geobacillus sp. 44C]MED4970419.1 acylphosphatase [Parageobacillus toebii]MED4989590.1 acylphosphatase [Parageobacillus toebii]OXB93823.1 acylphosphatase [Parageobacillus galactosidasius]